MTEEQLSKIIVDLEKAKIAAEELRLMFDACEAKNFKLLGQINLLEDGNMRQANLIGEQNVRIEKLEELCRDMFSDFDSMAGAIENYPLKTMRNDYSDRMKDLGLLEIIDPTENELLMDTFFKDAQGKTPIEQLEALTEACRKQVD